MKFKIGQKVKVVTWRHVPYNDEPGVVVSRYKATNYNRTSEVNKYGVLTLAGEVYLQENELREVK